MPLPDQIRRRRDGAGYTLDELAARTGISKTYLWELEKDEAKRPSADVLIRIAKALDTTIAELLEQPTVTVDNRSVAIPPSLRAFADRMQKVGEPLSDKDLADLALTRFRGGQPNEIEGWHELYWVLKRASNRPR